MVADQSFNQGAEPSQQERKRGRPRKQQERSDSVVAERKEKYWGEARNAKRREVYANDPVRAEAVREQRRRSYRKAKGLDEGGAQSCLANLDKVASSGSIAAVTLDGRTFVLGRVFTQADVALLLDRQPQDVYRWRKREIFPAPILRDDKGATFYADDEVTEFIRVFGHHQSAHYRVDHTDTRARLNAASFSVNPDKAQAWISKKV